MFADPSQAWAPTDFPNLPSSSLVLTAQGRAQDGNLSTLTLTNAIVYEPFEPTSIRPQLQKQIQISQGGLVTFQDTKVGFASTSVAAFSYGTSSFTQSNLAGAGIQDIQQPYPDTITNALAKLDGWITAAFLLQPPAVTPLAPDTNSLYGGMRWSNFNTYALLDKAVPYVNSLLIIIGDPTSSDYLSLEVTDPQYFPFRTFTSGLSPLFAPIVKLQIFSDFFPEDGNVNYTKAALPANCIYVLDESGNITLPDIGKVVSISNTNGTSTYTTLSLYLPNLQSTYPVGTEVPVRILFLNATAGNANVCLTSTLQVATGAPSALNSLTGSAITPYTASFQLIRPQYSDALHSNTNPYFSSYTLNYTWNKLAVAHNNDIGFRYGVSNPMDFPSTLSTYANTIYAKSYIYTGSNQTIAPFSGLSSAPLTPGVVWSTSAYATNSVFQAGSNTGGTLVSTLFPYNSTPSISSVNLVNTLSTYTRYSNIAPLYTPTHLGAGVWNIGTQMSNDVVFLSTPTQVTFQLESDVKLNDASFPGDRSTMTARLHYRNVLGMQNLAGILVLSTNQEVFPTNTLLSNLSSYTTTGAFIQDVYSDDASENFFNKVMLSGSINLSTFSTTLQELQISLENRSIPSFNGTITTNTLSTPVYAFLSQPQYPLSIQNLSTTLVQGQTYISGILTPSPNTLFYSDLRTQNFMYRYSMSSFVTAYIQSNNIKVSPIFAYSTLGIFDGTTPVTTLPFSPFTTLTLSSFTTQILSNVYQDPFDPMLFELVAAPTAANPSQITFASTTLSSLFVDTASYPCFLSSFSTTTNIFGRRVLNLLPRIEAPGTQFNMNDGVSNITGAIGPGLNVAVSSFYTVESNVILVSSFVDYNHMSSLSTTAYTDFYSRELLYTNNKFIHSAGYNFAQFSASTIGAPINYIYPDFAFDMYYDQNFGYRYATFAFEWSTFAAPTPYRYAYIKFNNPSLVSSIVSLRNFSTNNCFPNFAVNNILVSSMKVRLHAKFLGNYYTGIQNKLETAWVNGFKEIDPYNFDDSEYDVGAAMSANVTSNAVEYKVVFNRRYYTHLMSLVRVGIAQDASIYSGQPISFQNIQVRLSDV